MTGIDVLKTVYVANLLAVLLLAILRLSSTWSVYIETFEKKTLQRMLLITVICCCCDPIVYTLDGRPGMFPLIMDYVGNSFLFLGNLCVGVFWIHLLESHLAIHISEKHKLFHKILFGFGVACIIVNVFVPLIFTLENNVYQRRQFFWIFFLIALVYMVDGLIMYINTRRRGGVLKNFPVLIFILPIAVGMTIQSLFYGISTIWPSVAIGLAGIMSSVQNEKIVIDKLTGIYNRFYLDYLQQKAEKKGMSSITGVMIDINDFKKINDNFGHATGDDALIETAKLLTDAVGEYGNVTRYAGDEFVILINSIDDSLVKTIVKNIRDAFDRFNKTSGKPYQLSVAIGYSMFDLSSQSMSEFMNIIDKAMYEDKNAYHNEH